MEETVDLVFQDYHWSHDVWFVSVLGLTFSNSVQSFQQWISKIILQAPTEIVEWVCPFFILYGMLTTCCVSKIKILK